MAAVLQSVRRRTFLVRSVGVALASAPPWLPTAWAQQPEPKSPLSKDEWMAEWMRTKSLGGGLYLGRFLDPMYFLTKTISWKPNPPQAGIYSPVDVPIGFVTDLTSVPQPFWSLLRPDGEYTYAAIIHDYLYWTQTVSRPIADDILKFAMQDLGVDGMTIFAIHQAVSLAGGNAWEENRRLKNKGEKRILKVFPVDPKVRWEDYKKNSDVLA